MDELTGLRLENGKVFDKGKGERRLVASAGPIHWHEKEDDPWEDIDLTMKAGVVEKAPYILEMLGGGTSATSKPSFSFASRKGGVFEITLECAYDASGLTLIAPNTKTPVLSGNTLTWKDMYLDTDVVLAWGNNGISLKRILKSKDSPLDYYVKIDEKVKSEARLLPLVSATDADGKEVSMEASNVIDGRREKVISTAGFKFPIEDATAIVATDTKDGYTDRNDVFVYETTHDGAGERANTAGITLRIGQSFLVINYTIYRAAVFFDTGAVIDARDTINSATLTMVVATAAAAAVNGDRIQIQHSATNPAWTGLVTGDYLYSHYGTTNGGVSSEDIRSMINEETVPIVLNATGLGWIGQGAGNRTILMLRSTFDIGDGSDGTAPVGAEQIAMHSADNVLGRPVPTLTVDYTVPGGGVSIASKLAAGAFI